MLEIYIYSKQEARSYNCVNPSLVPRIMKPYSANIIMDLFITFPCRAPKLATAFRYPLSDDQLSSVLKGLEQEVW